MSIGWIDFSKSERNNVLNVIHRLYEDDHGAVDELGLGAIRDAFSDCFFPGTSTVQTRAKYFLIVPYILIEAGNGVYGYDLNGIICRIDDEERKCRDIMLKTSSDGVIGRLVPNSWVLRAPSNIYWNGIKKIGIFKEDISVEQYINQSIRQLQRKKLKSCGNREMDADENERDDFDAGDISSIQFWNVGDLYQSNWKDGLTIDLLPKEADFLKQQIIASHRDTLFAYILRNGIDLDRYDTFAAMTEEIKYSVDDDLRYIIDLANSFNNLVSIITTRYNLLVSNGLNEKALDMWGYLSKNLQRKSDVDLMGIYKQFDDKVNNQDLKKFLIRVQNALKDGNIDKVDALIKAREINLKGAGRAKICNAVTASVQQWVGIDILDYRYKPTKRIVRDILKVKEVSDV